MNTAVVGFLFFVLSAVYAQDPKCCHQISEWTSCQEVCDNMALVRSSIRRRQHLPSLLQNCPMNLRPFWHCVNESAPDIWEEDTGWMGRTCCHNARDNHCQAVCTKAKSFREVRAGCSSRDEDDLFECLTRFQHKEECCGQATPESQCRKKCEKLFDYPIPTKHMVTDAKVKCDSRYPEVVNCLTNYTTNVFSSVNPKDSLHCCQSASSDTCQQVCEWAYYNFTTENEIITAVIEGCGNPDLADDMWKCFLRDPVSRPNKQSSNEDKLSVDSARLQCCTRAVSDKCREICIKLYSTSWSSPGQDIWNEFDEYCQYEPVEASLLICLSDVQEPCQPGCTGLDYCTNFNDRPAELFRGCNSRSDISAEEDMGRWSNGIIQMPFLDIPVLDIAECQSDQWKAIACTLQIKPCDARSHTNMICRSDCIQILNQCMDQSRLAKGLNAEILCNILSPMEKNAPCVSLNEYLAPSAAPMDQASSLTYPCMTHSCANQTRTQGICSIDRDHCGLGQVCRRNKCEEGCKLGEASTFLVPIGTWARLTDPNNEGCYQACQCGKRGELNHCQTLRCTRTPTNSCRVNGHIKEHGSHYEVDCNICTCYGGTEICSSRQCPSDEIMLEDRPSYTGLPCDCSDEYVPMCANNGKTYPSVCFAKCAEKRTNPRIGFGDCSKINPCSDPNICQEGTWCVPRRSVCLSTSYGKCPQYECVSPLSGTCEDELYVPVCDTEGMGHPNMCMLHSRGKLFAYRGSCHSECHGESSKVCGHNGETYPSKCVAWQDKTTVDYMGPCLAVGSILDDDTVPQCSATIQCPELPSSNCVGVTPPGGCCPVCAGQLRILFSKIEADRVTIAMGSEALILGDVLELLRKQIVVSECDLYGFLSIEGDIVVLVQPVPSHPTAVQIDVCNSEAQKLGTLINTRSPLLVSYLQLTPLLAASTRTVTVSENSAFHVGPSYTYVLLLLVLCSCLQRYLTDR